MISLRSSLLIACLVSSVGVSSCTKPKERQAVDEHLKKAFDLAAKDPETALSELSQAKDITPAQRAYVKGLALEGKKDFVGAEVSLKEAVAIDPEALLPRTALARVQVILRKGDEAAGNLTKVIEKDPGSLPAILLLVVCHSSDELKRTARLALESWPETRPSADRQVPLRAEYFLALASVAKDAVSGEEALAKSKSAEIGSIPAVLTFAQFSVLSGKLALARGLVSRLAHSEATSEQLESIASVALSAGEVGAAGHALGRIPGNIRSSSLLALRGQLDLREGHPTRAVTHFSAALVLAKKADQERIDELEYYLARAHRDEGNPSEARKLLELILKRAPDHRASQFLMSEIELSSGQRAEAVARLQSLEKKYPKDVSLLLRLGDALVRADRFAEAELRYRAALKLVPEDDKIPRQVVQALREQRNEAGALSFLQDTRKARPDSLALLRAEVEQLLRMKQGPEAIATIERGAKGIRDQVGVQLLLADTYDTLGNEEALGAVLESLVQTQKKSAVAWSAYARLQGRRKDFAGMEKSLRTVLELSPRALKDKARLATVLNKTGKSAEAAKLFGELAAASESDVVALNNAAVLYAGELNEPEKAVDFAEKAHSLAPKNRSIMDTLGWALLQKGKEGDLERATSLLQRASGKGESAESLYHYGVALQKSGKKVEGAKLIRQALAVTTDGAWRLAAEAAVTQK